MATDYKADRYDSIAVFQRDISRFPILNADQEYALFEKYALTGDPDIKHRILMSNIPYIIDIAKDYHLHKNPGNLGIGDLIHEGYIGLQRAFNRFEYEKGYRLLTYATDAIIQQMDRAVQGTGNTIRLPYHIHDKESQILRAIAKQKRKNPDYVPTKRQLAECTGLSEEEINQALSTRPLKDTDSLDQILGEGDTNRYYYKSQPHPTPDEIAETNDRMEAIYAALDKLDERSRQIIIWRYGLNGEDQKTMEECGDIFDVSKQRIQQIEAEARQELAKYLKGFAGE